MLFQDILRVFWSIFDVPGSHCSSFWSFYYEVFLFFWSFWLLMCFFTMRFPIICCLLISIMQMMHLVIPLSFCHQTRILNLSGCFFITNILSSILVLIFDITLIFIWLIFCFYLSLGNNYIIYIIIHGISFVTVYIWF